MDSSADELFDLVDDILNDAAKSLMKRWLAGLPEPDRTPEQDEALQSKIRERLDQLMWSILGLFDNVGSVLPENIDGWTLHSKTDGMDIRIGNADYADMWLKHLRAEGRLPR